LSKCASPRTKGFYFGLFWSVAHSSQIIASLTGALMFEHGTQKTYLFISMAFVSIIATASFLFVKQPLVYYEASIETFELGNKSQYFSEQQSVAGSLFDNKLSIFRGSPNTPGLAASGKLSQS